MTTVSLLPGSRRLPDQLTLTDQPAYQGGEGRIYFSSDGQYAVKIYHKPSDNKRNLLQQILMFSNMLGEYEQFLAWPLGIVSRMNGSDSLGVVTRRVPPTHQSLINLIYSPKQAVKQFDLGRSWLEYLKISRGTAAAVRTIHGKGIAHGDIHYKNFLANPQTGEVVMIDLDGMIVKGVLPPQVKGLRGFIAPEVVQGLKKPDELSDRYSLAVVILWILLLRNVMMTQKEYDAEDLIRSDELGFGKFACFSENPNDRRNWLPTIGTPLYHQGALSYRTLTPRLQELTDQALIIGLTDPVKRPLASEWEKALAEVYDTLICCPICRQSYVYPYWIQPPPRRQCPFCGTGVRTPYPAVLELKEEKARGLFYTTRTIVLYHGLPLFEDISEPGCIPPFSRRNTKRIGQVVWEPKGGVHRLANMSDSAWTIISGGTGSVPRGVSVELQKGLTFSFGVGKRLARVVE